jgi:hypothetical protein
LVLDPSKFVFKSVTWLEECKESSKSINMPGWVLICRL